jgi:ligand-binding SRPBCC domain-containing protein
MSISACPITSIDAPLERVWAFLSEPENYALWWDAETRTITPGGHAAPGQVIDARTSGLGFRWKVRLTVNGIDEARHTLDLTTSLPLGITVYNHITCAPLDTGGVRVAFG